MRTALPFAENTIAELQGLKPLKKAQIYVVPEGTTHKTYEKLSHNGLCGSRLQPRDSKASKNKGFSP
jgi:hypothetical protein